MSSRARFFASLGPMSRWTRRVAPLLYPAVLHPLGRHADELSAAQHRRTGGPTIARQQTEQRHARLRLARAGLADDRQHLTGVDRVIEVFGGRPPFIADPELHSEVVDLE